MVLGFLKLLAGTKPDLGSKKYNYKDRISSEARQALDALIRKVD
jgi:hypothetical protein